MPKKIETIQDAKVWVEKNYSDFAFDIIGFATKQGPIIPLNLEPGTLGNIIEGVLIAHLNQKIAGRRDVIVKEGGFRKYPDLELTGALFNNKLIALDIKAARRSEANKNRTQSRITLYTFGSYLKYQDRKFPQNLRPFEDYKFHLDLIVLFDVNQKDCSVDNFEILIVEPWRVASKTASSATRDYVGAVMEIDRLRKEKGEFKTRKEFYDFWAGIPRRGESPS